MTAPVNFSDLTDDTRAVLIRQLQEVMQTCHTLAECVGKGLGNIEEMSKAALSLCEYKLVDIAKTLGVETNGTTEIEERHVKLRTANMRVRALEEQLGKSGSAAQTAASLKVLGARLNKWWDLEGFAHINDIQFTEHGYLKVQFSCHLFGEFRLTGSRTPISDKQRRADWFADLTRRGFELVNEEGGRDMELVDSDASRAVLRQLFSTRFPSSSIISYGNYGNRNGTVTMKDVTLIIYDLSELEQLPVREEPVEA